MKKDIIRQFCIWTLILVISGCGKEDAPVQEAPKAEIEEAASVEEEKEQPKEEVTEEQNQQKEEQEVVEEISSEMPNAQVTTTVANLKEFISYVYSLDQEKPYIFVYNKEEGYVINMGENEYYQLKKNDNIFTITPDSCVSYSGNIVGINSICIDGHLFEEKVDYSTFESPQEIRLKAYFSDDPSDKIKITCYMDAPVD